MTFIIYHVRNELHSLLISVSVISVTRVIVGVWWNASFLLLITCWEAHHKCPSCTNKIVFYLIPNWSIHYIFSEWHFCEEITYLHVVCTMCITLQTTCLLSYLLTTGQIFHSFCQSPTTLTWQLCQVKPKFKVASESSSRLSMHVTFLWSIATCVHLASSWYNMVPRSPHTTLYVHTTGLGYFNDNTHWWIKIGLNINTHRNAAI